MVVEKKKKKKKKKRRRNAREKGKEGWSVYIEGTSLVERG